MGKHNAPRKPVVPTLVRAGAVTIATTGAFTLTSPIAEAAPVSSSILETIAKCESGNQNVNHNSARSGIKSTASGYLQILDSTWRAFGGSQFASRAINASREEQFIVGQRILAGQGINAWGPSKSCWGSKIGKVETPPPVKIIPQPVPKKVEKPAPAPAPTPVVKKVTPKPVAKPQVKKTTSAPKVIKKQTAPPPKEVAKKVAKIYTIHHGDTLSGIARTHGSTVRRLASLNSDTVHNVNLIYAGKKLRLG